MGSVNSTPLESVFGEPFFYHDGKYYGGGSTIGRIVLMNSVLYMMFTTRSGVTYNVLQRDQTIPPGMIYTDKCNGYVPRPINIFSYVIDVDENTVNVRINGSDIAFGNVTPFTAYLVGYMFACANDMYDETHVSIHIYTNQ